MMMANVTQELCLGLTVIHFNVTQDIYITVVTTSILNSFFSIVAVLTNTLVLISIARSRNIQSCSNLLLANLSVADFLVGLLVQPLHVSRKVSELRDIHLCELRLVYMFFGFLCSGASVLTLCLVSCERYVAVVKPLRYSTLVTMSRVLYSVGVMWFLWMLCCVAPFLGLSMEVFFRICFAMMFISFMVTALTYQRIFRIARRHNNKIHSLPTHGDQENEQRIFRRENKAARTTAIIAGAVVTCYMPQISLLFVRGVLGDSVKLVHVGDTWADTIIFINSSLNPVIYCWRNADIRREVIKTFRFITRLTEPNLTEVAATRNVIPGSPA